MQVQRRTVLALGGAAALGAVAGGVGVASVLRNGGRPAPATVSAGPVTFDAWRQRRAAPYFVAHRGAGTVAPEHTLPSYLQALAWGAEAIEISVVRSADDQLFCLHDLTLDRTTNGTGPAARLTAAELDRVRVTVPRLGPRWVGAGAPPLPRLADVLATVGRRAVLCLEAKDDSAYPLMVALVEDLGLEDTVMIKLAGGSTERLQAARSAGYPVYAYLGNAKVATGSGIDKLTRLLDPQRDALVLPARDGTDLFPDAVIRRAVDTGVPVWVVPVHRRHEVEHFGRLGAQGFVTPDLGYLTAAVAPLLSDVWDEGAVSSGELTRDPYQDQYGLHWEDTGAIAVDVPDKPAFVTLGQFCPITAPSYRLTLEAAFDPLPEDTWQHLSIAFGHADDRYYEHRSGDSAGYHAQLRADGGMALYTHVEGERNGLPLTVSQSSRRFSRGLWSRLTLDVTPTVIRFTRDDGTFVEARDERFRGGYLHLGRSGQDGRVKVRNLRIT